MTGEAFEYIERLDVYEDYVADLKPWDVGPNTRALADLCLVLLNAKGERVVCFDNAHSVPEGFGPAKKFPKQHDHKHIGSKITPYVFKDAFTLLQDFWKEVDKMVQLR